MVIHDLNVMSVAITPGEADAPLVINANAICPRAAAFQKLELVSRRHTKIPQAKRPMQVKELSPRRPFDGLKSPNHVVLKERLSV
jgi:hypothetical protein